MTGNTHGGGPRTNANGLRFEQETQLFSELLRAGFTIKEVYKVYKNNVQIGWNVPKTKLYSQFLKPNGINYKNYISKQWQPDECFINIQNNTAYIIEKKFQSESGSVDEKLAGCEFKKQEYEKIFFPLRYTVEYIYLFNDWFKKDRYKDFLEYIESKNCPYYFNEIPLSALGLE